MIYLPRNRTKHNYLKKVGVLAGFFVVGGIIFSIFDGLIIRAVAPVWQAENVVSRSVVNAFTFLSSKHSLIEENESLKQRLSSLEVELAGANLGQETESFLALIGRTKDSGGIPAAVLTHPPQTPYDILIVDAGLHDGVIVGSRVFLPEGPELGVVEEIFGKQSRVKLFSSSEVETNAVLERHQVPVVLEGVGAGNFKIIVPRETEVVVGDKVISPALDSTLVAIVEDVKVSPTDSFKEVLARSPINIFEVRTVLIRQ